MQGTVTDPDPDIYVYMMEYDQADDGIRVLMAMQTAETTEPRVEQPNAVGGNIGPAVAPVAPCHYYGTKHNSRGSPPLTVDPIAGGTITGAPMQPPVAPPITVIPPGSTTAGPTVTPPPGSAALDPNGTSKAGPPDAPTKGGASNKPPQALSVSISNVIRQTLPCAQVFSTVGPKEMKP